jgi:hypothetical protein
VDRGSGQVRQYAAKIGQLQEELAMERALTDRLCKDLEDPRNTDRWKALPGENPDPEQLLTKIEVGRAFQSLPITFEHGVLIGSL